MKLKNVKKIIVFLGLVLFVGFAGAQEGHENGQFDIATILSENNIVLFNALLKKQNLSAALYFLESCKDEEQKVILDAVSWETIDIQLIKNMFLWACNTTHIGVVEKLLEKNKNLVDITANPDGSVFHRAAERGNLAIISVLLKQCPNKALLTSSSGTTPLHLACIHKQIEIAKLLLAAKPALALARTDDGFTCLHNACFTGLMEIVLLLLEQDPKLIHVKSNKGTTVFHSACLGMQKEVLQLLWKQCPELLTHATTDGITPFHFLCMSGPEELIHLLLQYNAKILDVQALQLACAHKRVNVVDRLLATFGRSLTNYVGPENKIDISRTASHDEQGFVIILLFLQYKQIKHCIVDKEQLKRLYEVTKFSELLSKSSKFLKNQQFKELRVYQQKNCTNNNRPLPVLRIVRSPLQIEPIVFSIVQNNNDVFSALKHSLLGKTNHFKLRNLSLKNQQKIKKINRSLKNFVLVLSVSFDLSKFVDSNGNNLLHIAIKADNKALSALLIALNRNLMFMKNGQGFLPMQLACDGKFATLGMLISLKDVLKKDAMLNPQHTNVLQTSVLVPNAKQNIVQDC